LSTVLKVLSLVVIGILGISALGKSKAILTLFEGHSSNPGNYALALYSALWAYDGWNNLNLVTGELKNPARNLPPAIVIGPTIVIVCYILANVACYAMLSFEVITASNALAIDFGKIVFGSFGGIIISLVVIGLSFGAANASILSRQNTGTHKRFLNLFIQERILLFTF
jgi:amino acid transporter